MIVMARIYFNKPDVEDGIAALRAAGYGVLIHAVDDPNFVYLEASRDIEVAPDFDAEFDDRDEIQVELDAEWDRVNAIIDPLYGEIVSIGPLRAASIRPAP
jgi:hypothetical protein